MQNEKRDYWQQTVTLSQVEEVTQVDICLTLFLLILSIVNNIRINIYLTLFFITIYSGGHAGGGDVKYNIENRLNQVTTISVQPDIFKTD